jgi:hypothetical protein
MPRSRTQSATVAPTPRLALSVQEFCEAHRISVQMFYKLRPQGLMPVTFNVGTRVLISREAAEAWRRARENATQRDLIKDPKVCAGR